MTLAPPAMPECRAIQPACRPITSTTRTRWWDSAVVCSRSMASVAMFTAVSKPKVKSVASRSLSMVLGTPTTRTPSSVEPRGDAEGVLAADRDERVDPGALEVLPDPLDPAVDLERVGARRAEDRAAAWQDAARTSATPERHGQPLERAPPAVAEADELVPVARARPCGPTARMTAFRPGQSPPPVSTPTRMASANRSAARSTGRQGRRARVWRHDLLDRRASDGDALGVAVATKFLAVGSAVPAAAAGVGAIATQAYANVAYKADVLDLLAAGATAEARWPPLTGADDGRDHPAGRHRRPRPRRRPTPATECIAWAGGAGPATAATPSRATSWSARRSWTAMEDAWLGSPHLPVAARLMPP